PTGHNWPWQEDPALLEGTNRPPGAVVIERPGQPRLLAATLASPGGTRWVLWLEDDRRPGFSESEQAALALVGHALARCLAGNSPSRLSEQLDRAARQQQLEVAASV